MFGILRNYTKEGKSRLLVLDLSRPGQVWFPEAENVLLTVIISLHPLALVFTSEVR